MSSSINGTTITLTRGDTFLATVSMTDAQGEAYIPGEGDEVRFKCSKSYPSEHGTDTPLIEKVLDNSTLLLELDPEDTDGLRFGEYVYDVQLTTAAGVVDTFIPKGRLIIAEELD